MMHSSELEIPSIFVAEDDPARMAHENFFEPFWERCRDEYLKGLKGVEALDKHDYEIRSEYAKVQEEIKKYHQKIGALPFISVIVLWIRSVSADREWARYYIDAFDSLLKKGLICIHSYGKIRPISEVALREHIATIENIKCVKEWTYLDKENLITSYVKFSNFLAQYTLNLIPRAYDPDRLRVEGKAIKYQHFIEFIQHLSPRDSLFAKLLYFGAPSVEALITSEKAMFDFHNQAISFNGNSVTFPKHLILDIQEYVNSRKDSNDLLFVNIRGGPVERTHLINTFSRVSSKMSGDIKISPSDLLKFKSDV